MTGLTLKLPEAQTAAIVRRLRAKAPIAIARALNRTAANVKTAMTRIVAQDVGVKQAYVRDRLAIREAVATGKLLAIVYANAKRIPVYAFAPSPSQPPSRGRGTGVSWRSHGRRVRDTQAFIATVGRGGHTGVFKRVGASRKSRGAWSKNLPIRELMGPSIAHVFSKHVAVGEARAAEQLTKNLQHEFKFALTQS